MARMSSIEQTVRELVELITRGEYEAVAKMTGGVRMSADDLREAVDEYGYDLSSPGSGWWDMVNVIAIDDSDPPAFAVDAPMWEPDGDSDLMLELKLTETGEDDYDVEVQGLHVQ